MFELQTVEMFLAILPIPFGSKFKYFTVEIRIIISKLWRMNEWNRNYSNVIFSLLFPSSLSDHSVSPTLCTFFRDLTFFSFSFFQRRKRKNRTTFATFLCWNCEKNFWMLSVVFLVLLSGHDFRLLYGI